MEAYDHKRFLVIRPQIQPGNRKTVPTWDAVTSISRGRSSRIPLRGGTLAPHEPVGEPRGRQVVARRLCTAQRLHTRGFRAPDVCPLRLPGYRPLAFLLIRLVPDWFSLDLEVLEDIGRSTRLDEVRELCGDFKVGVRHRPSFIRDTLGLRTSGRRVFAIAQQILGQRPSS